MTRIEPPHAGLRRLPAGALPALLALGLFTAPVEAAPTGKVTASRLNVRAGPGTREKVLGTLDRGDRVTIHKRRSGWLLVTGPGRPPLRGWVSGRYVDESAGQGPSTGSAGRGREETGREGRPKGEESKGDEAKGDKNKGDKPAPSIRLRDLKERKARLAFIHDTKRSTLDLLGEKGRRWRRFPWQFGDYPGSPKGPNEGEARALATALRGLIPERRVNRGETRLPFDWKAVEPALVKVAGEERYRLNRHAAKAYLAMRKAAKADGVTLSLVSAARSPKRQAQLAKGNSNPAAVAQGVSAHSYGLAIDLAMSPGAEAPLKEVTTRPFSNVMAMRRSPVHKWMALNGARFGWFPYTHEPWHWEYNPPGFARRFP